jgi:hypothetical protein
MIARFWIWFFFERVEVDSLLVGAVLPRKVHYTTSSPPRS